MKYLLIPLNIATFWLFCWVASKCGPGDMKFFPGFPIICTTGGLFVVIIVWSISVFDKDK